MAPTRRHTDTDLIRRAQHGDTNARREVAERNLGLVDWTLARLGYMKSPHREEYRQEAVLELMRCIDAYDPKRAAWSSFVVGRLRLALNRVRQQVQRRALTVPAGRAAERVDRIKRADTTLWQTLGREPTANEIAQAIGEDATIVQRVIADANALSLDDLIEPTVEDPAFAAIENRDAVAGYLRLLTGQQREVVERYFGLNGHDEGSLTEIAQAMSLDRRRVGESLTKAIDVMNREATR